MHVHTLKSIDILIVREGKSFPENHLGGPLEFWHVSTVIILTSHAKVEDLEKKKKISVKVYYCRVSSRFTVSFSQDAGLLQGLGHLT